MKVLLDMQGNRYEVPDDVAAKFAHPTAALMFDSDGGGYEVPQQELGRYQAAQTGTEGRLAVLNAAAVTEPTKGGAPDQPRLCGPIVTWCSGGFCLE